MWDKILKGDNMHFIFGLVIGSVVGGGGVGFVTFKYGKKIGAVAAAAEQAAGQVVQVASNVAQAVKKG